MGPPFCEGTDGVTLMATAESPFARVAVDPAAALCAAPAPNTVCDLVMTGTVDGALVQLAVTTSHGPFSTNTNTVST
jgi:hypothetical protein